MTRDEIFRAIVDERVRQDRLHGPALEREIDPIEWYLILAEEVGEVATALQHRDLDELELELVHVAAVAFATLEVVGELRRPTPIGAPA